MNNMRILIAYDGSSGADAALFDLQRAGLPQEAEALVISVADVWTFPSASDDPQGLRAKKPDVIGLNKEDWQAGRFASVPGESEFIPLPESGPATVRYP